MKGIRKSLENRPRHALGQFFTPQTVADFAVDMLISFGAFENARRAIDPSAGAGNFLQAVATKASLECVGLDLDRALATSTIHHANGLLDHPHLRVTDGAFDVAVGNPPYGGQGLHDLMKLTRGEGDVELWELLDAIIQRSELWKIASDQASPPELADRKLTPRLARLIQRVARFPIENLFMERFVRLLRPGGWLAVVVPDGVLANARSSYVRDWMARRGRVAAVIGLPRVFSRAGASARTAVLFYQREPARTSVVRLSDAGSEWRPRGAASDVAVGLQDYLSRAARVEVAWEQMRDTRWDPQFWDPRYASPLRGLPDGERHTLGDFISHMTYGPIVTKRKPSEFSGSIPIVSQGQFEESGINLTECARVQAGCIFDPARSRARRRDLLFPRSGAGSLGRNRLAVYDEEEEANVGCFVNVIRLEGINPYFVWLFLKTSFGWGQLRRIINGVGMPNISFDEIRGLVVPGVSVRLQQSVEDVYVERVRPAHRALIDACGGGGDVAGARRTADAHIASLVKHLERALAEGADRVDA